MTSPPEKQHGYAQRFALVVVFALSHWKSRLARLPIRFVTFFVHLQQKIASALCYLLAEISSPIGSLKARSSHSHLSYLSSVFLMERYPCPPKTTGSHSIVHRSKSRAHHNADSFSTLRSYISVACSPTQHILLALRHYLLLHGFPFSLSPPSRDSHMSEYFHSLGGQLKLMSFFRIRTCITISNKLLQKGQCMAHHVRLLLIYEKQDQLHRWQQSFNPPKTFIVPQKIQIEIV